ncbi:MAG: hypothetical protein LCI00_34040 [Chloroflexi bacterium]|nr:hypothetical protein [Chloroflexota bacterium]MCC6894437.1 hypothetical protein [Anaerolineae bacterium]
MAIIDRRKFYKAIDDMSEEELAELASFMDYLQYKHKTPQGSPWARELYELFAPMRQDAIESGMTSEEIDQLLDEELAEVRRDRNP